MKYAILSILVLAILIGGGFLVYKARDTSISNFAPTPEVPTTPPEAGNLNSTPGTPTPAEAVKSFTVIGKKFFYSPNTLSVNQGDVVKLTFRNEEGMHDLVIEGYGKATRVIAQGSEEAIQFVANQKGTFQFYCSVPGHRAQGMAGTLTVN